MGERYFLSPTFSHNIQAGAFHCTALRIPLANGSSIPDNHRPTAFLAKKNRFLVPLDNEGIWYRWLHLFQALLIQQMGSALSKERQLR